MPAPINVWKFRSNRGRKYTKITSSTAETVVVPAYKNDSGEPIYTDLYGLVIANTSASACKVTLKDTDDANSEPIVYEVPATDTRGFMLPKEQGMQQNEAGKPWTVTCGGSVDSIEVTALFMKNS